jgi:hypothetical protein
MKRTCSLIICLVLLTLSNGATKAQAQTQPPGGNPRPTGSTVANTTFSRFFLQDPLSSTAYWHSHTVVDASGGIHVTFYDTSYIYYVHCAANCENSANWSELPLFAVGYLSSLDEPTLAVDTNGHPRLIWYSSNESGTFYYYAECNDHCTDSASYWTSVAVTSLGAYGYPQNIRYAALDNQNRPHLVYAMTSFSDYGFYYLSCDSGCITASNWYTTTIVTNGLEPDEFQLVFDPNGRPRVLGYDSNDSELVYAECNSNCTTASNWGSVGILGPVYYLSEFGYAFRVNAQGYPRIAYYDENVNNNVLYYAWSNASPLIASNWHNYTLNYPTDTDYWSLDLAIDSQGRPLVAYATDTLNMSLVTCTSNCETTSHTWQQQAVETENDLNASFPIPTNSGCLSSTWMVIGYPSPGLNAANSPSVSYWARHAQLCSNSFEATSIMYDAESIRIATSGGTSQNYLLVYLPLLTR